MMKLFNSLIFFVALLFCSSPDKSYSNFDLLNIFEKWFISADSSLPKPLLKLSDVEIDSIVKVIRKKSIKGRGRVILRDSCGKEFIVGFSTPLNYREDTLYPCLIYLHGGISTEFSTKGEKAYEMFNFLADSMDIFLVSPSANREVPWWSPIGISRILQTLRFITLYYPIDPNKIFLAGVSDGATGCYAAANTIPSHFAGFIAVSGFGGMLSYFGIKLSSENLMQRPIYNVNSGKDRLYPIEVVNEFLDSLQEKGVNIFRKIYPEEEHGFEYRYKEAGEICKIIREWSKPQNPSIYARIPQDFPYCFDHILSIKKKKELQSQSLFVQAYCEGENYYIKQQGIEEITLYFDESCDCINKILTNTNKRVKVKLIEFKGNNQNKLRLLKQVSCPYFPKLLKVVNINF